MDQHAPVTQGDAGKDSVRDRLLDAAEVLFCERGFDGVSVRDLTGQANCNVAAVNYYFGGKDKLYQEMFKRQVQDICCRQIARINEAMGVPNPTLESVLREIIFMPLLAAYEKQQRGRIMRLMVREVLNKTVHGETILEAFHTQMMTHAVQALRTLVPQLDDKQARLAVFSVDSLKVHPFLFMDEFFAVNPGINFDEMVNHIVFFAAAGIRAMAAR